jgi:hypothetical protein
VKEDLEAHQMATSPPSIASGLGYLRDEFNVDDIDDNSNDVGLVSDMDENIRVDALDIADSL